MTSTPPKTKEAKPSSKPKKAEVPPSATVAAQRAARTAAPGAALGFSLQQTRMVVRLLQADPGDVVSLEVFDDVGVRKADGTVIAEQGKSTSGYNPLADRAVAFWKTIANWLDAIDANILDAGKTHFEIYVSRPVPLGPICKSFDEATNTASAIRAAVVAREELWGVAPTFAKRRGVADTLAPHLERVFAHADSAVAELLERMRILLGSGNPYDEIRPLMTKKLVSEDAYENVAHWAIGWVKKETDQMIQRGEPAHVAYSVFHAALCEYVRRHDRETTLRSVAGTPAPEIVAQHRVVRTYVNQLEIVGASDDDVLVAINDYLRAATDRTFWAEHGHIDEHILDEFAAELKITWRNLQRRIEIAQRTATEEDRGLLLFGECNEHNAKPGGLTGPPHFTRGSFHALAEDETIGWHPNYAAELKRLRAAGEVDEAGGDCDPSKP